MMLDELRHDREEHHHELQQQRKEQNLKWEEHHREQLRFEVANQQELKQLYGQLKSIETSGDSEDVKV